MDNDPEIMTEIWFALSVAESRDGSLDHVLKPFIEELGCDTVMSRVWLLHLDGLIEVREVISYDDPCAPWLSVIDLSDEGRMRLVQEELDRPIDEY